MASIELFNIHYRASVCAPPVRLLCQGVDVDGEKLLWVDGLDVANPVVIPLASVRALEWAGSFRDLMSSDLELAERVISEAQGEYSPAIMARMFLYMSHDPDMHTEEALDLAIKQGHDLISADEKALQSFRRAAANAGSYALARA